MPKLIIVCGLPGSGKTLLASNLSKETGIVCLHKDSIKEKLYESLDLSTLEDSKRIGKPSIDIMLYLAEQQLANGIDIIVEAPFNFSEDYSLFENWKVKYNINIYSVICYVDTEERKNRYKNRVRHKSHYDNERLFGHFPEKEYDYAEIPGKQIRIETNRPAGGLVKNIVSQID